MTLFRFGRTQELLSKVLDWIQQEGQFTEAEAQNLLGVSSTQTRRVLDELIRVGHVKAVTGEGPSRLYIQKNNHLAEEEDFHWAA